jgi:hypothetical protein
MTTRRRTRKMNPQPVEVSRRDDRHGLKDGVVLIWADATTFSKIVGFVLLVLATFSLITGWNLSAENRRIMECQAEFMDTVTRVMDARGQASQMSDDAVNAVMLDIAESMETENWDTIGESFAKYQDDQAEVQRFRENNPIPQVSVAEECRRR